MVDLGDHFYLQAKDKLAPFMKIFDLISDQYFVSKLWYTSTRIKNMVCLQPMRL